MIIEVDDDCVDMLIQKALVKDYVHLTEEIKREKKNPGQVHEDDIAAYKETIVGLEILGRWYFAWGEFDKAVKLARKKK